MRHITFGGLNQIRNEVITTFQLDLDLCERIADAVFQGNQLVVNRDAPNRYCGYDGEENEESRRVVGLPCVYE